MVPQNFKQMFLDATIHLVNAILKIVLYPFEFWTKATARLAQQKKPIYDPTVGLNLDLLFDGISFLSYPLGALYFLYTFFADKLYNALDAALYLLITIYVFPVVAWLASIVIKFAIKLAIDIIKIIWSALKSLVLKFYNFVVNPQWHFAIKHIYVNKKEE